MVVGWKNSPSHWKRITFNLDHFINRHLGGGFCVGTVSRKKTGEFGGDRPKRHRGGWKGQPKSLANPEKESQRPISTGANSTKGHVFRKREPFKDRRKGDRGSDVDGVSKNHGGINGLEDGHPKKATRGGRSCKTAERDLCKRRWEERGIHAGFRKWRKWGEKNPTTQQTLTFEGQ